MPIYEYQCTQCGEKFEVRQAIGEDSSAVSCPKCHTENPKRLFSSFFSPGTNAAELSDTSCPTCSSGVCGLPPMG
jgi:putative FmdB family regulatory protein